ncbi:DUF1223 domain-containing protein [Sphingomonas sp.]|uniref:DUF1223 domain-containing protein n=1 Tax=Sphingomonas sp. TaxID=28214 RepID=UPI0035C8777E
MADDTKVVLGRDRGKDDTSGMRAAQIVFGLVVVVWCQAARAADRQTVVELFTAQGCPACPAADAALIALASRSDVLALSYSVTYWNGRGWSDPLSRDEFTQRQRRYATIGRREAGTPQFVIDGRFATSTANLDALGRAIGMATRSGGPAVRTDGSRLRVGADARTARAAIVWLVDYDPRPIRTPIRAGETRGRTAVQINVVQRLAAVGRWTGTAASYRLPPLAGGLRRVALVQSADGGAIVAAARVR